MKISKKLIAVVLAVTVASGFTEIPQTNTTKPLGPLLDQSRSVDWFFAFKFNTATFPTCATSITAGSSGLFGGDVQPYNRSQQYIAASSKNSHLVKSDACIGATTDDPVGATFSQVYLSNTYNYVLWNDQFYGDPLPTRSAPWAHSKGMLAWDDNGDGFVLQVSTPNWPGSGSHDHPRSVQGNTLGTSKEDNIMFSQHFFCLKVNASDLQIILRACINAGVVTDPTNPQIVKNGGPDSVRHLVAKLGQGSAGSTVSKETLSSGVQLISKPPGIAAAPWQIVSAELGAKPLRVASWWEGSEFICSTEASTSITCWDSTLGKPGPVQIVESGTWDGQNFYLVGGNAKNGNHAKIGVSIGGSLCIFGDMNQEGTLTKVAGKPAAQACAIGQNARGGLFYVLDNPVLHEEMTKLLGGKTAPSKNCKFVMPAAAKAKRTQ